jgi:AcrR family transcriptional regulator
MIAQVKTRLADSKAENGGRRERRRAETREKIFRAALQLFSERSLSATTVEDITEAADVGKGTFFNYFDSKEHVLSVLAEAQLAKIHAALEAAQHADVPVKQTARKMILALAEVPGRSDVLARSLMMALLSNDEARAMLTGVLREGREVLARLFAIAQERGELSRRRKPMEMARAFQHSFFGTIMMWSMQPDGPVAGWLEVVFEMLWDGAASSATDKRRS